MWYAQLDASGIFSCCYLWITFYQDFVVVVVVAVVVIKCFMIGVTVWWVYLAAQNTPRAISVLTLGNKVILYCISLSWLVMNFVDVCSPFTVRACKMLIVWPPGLDSVSSRNLDNWKPNRAVVKTGARNVCRTQSLPSRQWIFKKQKCFKTYTAPCTQF